MKKNLMNELAPLLLPWFFKEQRDLPWRKTKDPYAIWVSEIMLQQTRVETVIPFYERFIERLPNVFALSEVDEDELLKLWEGLGYYSRVKNMQKAAIQMVQIYHGVFPKMYEELIKLPGIGSYTAGAILSIAFDLPYAAVDGNVLRICARFLRSHEDISLEEVKKKRKQQLEEVMPKESGAFNQALMDLGATICIPKHPKCFICPLHQTCLGYLYQDMENYPIINKKVKKQEEEITVLVFYSSDDEFLLNKKEDSTLLRGLYEFIHFSKKMTLDDIHSFCIEMKLSIEKIIPLPLIKHVFTHKIWKMNCYLVYISDKQAVNKMIWVNKEEIKTKYPISTAFKKVYLEAKSVLDDEEKFIN